MFFAPEKQNMTVFGVDYCDDSISIYTCTAMV